MKKVIIVGAIVIALTLSGCASTIWTRGYSTNESEMLYEGPPTIVIVGGSNEGDWVYLEPFMEGIPGSIGIVPNVFWRVSLGAEELYRQIREDYKIKGRVILVAGSLVGLHARGIDALHPGMVDMIITIGSPAGGYPGIVNSIFFGVGDEDSQTPLYVIAGYDDSSPRRFWMTSDKNDGIFDVEAVFDLGRRKVSGQRVFSGYRHMDMFKSLEIIQQVNDWVQQFRNERRVAWKNH